MADVLPILKLEFTKYGNKEKEKRKKKKENTVDVSKSCFFLRYLRWKSSLQALCQTVTIGTSTI